MVNFADSLLREIDAKQSPICVGLDPVVHRIPEGLRLQVMREYWSRFDTQELSPDVAIKATAELFFRFNKAIIDATHELVPAFKPQSAHYEKLGAEGVRALADTIKYVKEKGCIAVLDAKRQDIGKTANAYADAYLGHTELIDFSRTSMFDADAITIGPYLGSDSVSEFVNACEGFGKGAFVLVRTSNKSAGELQGVTTDSARPLYAETAGLVHEWGESLRGHRGFSSLGAVVGATYPEDAVVCRELMPHTIFLVPGYGSQNAKGDDVMPNFKKGGYGAVVNSASDITFAYQRQPYEGRFNDYTDAARAAVQDMKEDILCAMERSGKLPKGW